jgi:hypothetical protein
MISGAYNKDKICKIAKTDEGVGFSTAIRPADPSLAITLLFCLDKFFQNMVETSH